MLNEDFRAYVVPDVERLECRAVKRKKKRAGSRLRVTRYWSVLSRSRRVQSLSSRLLFDELPVSASRHTVNRQSTALLLLKILALRRTTAHGDGRVV